ncbi:GNAT family N-acetyltransferase [Clostridium algidicarnis]|uniref:GNAT family N-acetyltransferase n=1 Tax=Clostridium algidicarnis TaxID=37659 RepID=A0ABS6C014_9CLOT|nr:GNAT family N-acetyltransferase [Clostridium algidicarnis]MBU3218815.1 GNAT family N-acetyltransferase [Clostridium algidicarnis]MCB2286054.1 GNAT family N-acetyltransferase [Clostridium algidicarnis]
MFNPLFYGKGYATEGCNAILEYGFEKLGMHIEALIYLTIQLFY